MMRIYLPIHSGSFRSGEPAVILGTETLYPTGLPPRVCYHLRWPDGIEDFAPVVDFGFLGEPTYLIFDDEAAYQVYQQGVDND